MIQSALESTDPVSSSGGPTAKTWPLVADLAAFEKTKFQIIENNSCDFFSDSGATQPLQKWWDRPQVVRFRLLTHHSMRQDQKF